MNPRFERTSENTEPELRRFRVRETEETCSAVTAQGSEKIRRLVSIGPNLNVNVIDLCDDKTGEIRTFKADALEELKD